MLTLKLLSVASVLCLSLSASAAENNREHALSAYMNAAAESLGDNQRRALANIRDEGKRHLAMTYYLRAENSIDERWSWTQEQIETYEKSQERQQTVSEIQKIAKRFADNNRGYQLHVNTEVRSLEQQLSRWESVHSIEGASRQLHSAAMAELAGRHYANVPNPQSTGEWIAFLKSWRASSPPTLAAPGMSLHGRGRAYDFQISDAQGRIVAGTDTATIKSVWDAKRWSQKLSAAVKSASDRFIGPLEAPREPWHYVYRPYQ